MSFTFMAAVTVCSIFGSRENKICHCFYFFPFYLSWSNGTVCHDLSFFNVEFKPAFSLSFFTLTKRLFSSSLSAISDLAINVAQMVKNLPAIQETRFNPWVGKISWRREWQPTSVFLPGESHRQTSLVGYSPLAHTTLDTTEWPTLSFTLSKTY